MLYTLRKAMKIDIDGKMLSIEIADPWSLNRMLAAISPLIDLLINPLNENTESRDWASLELFKILSIPGNWEVLTHVKDGAKSNYALHNLSKKKREWLERFYEEKVLRK